VLLNDALRFQAAIADITATRHDRAPSIYESVESAPATVIKALRGREERPYAPVHLAGPRDGTGNLTITWVRRTRVNGVWADFTGDVPLSEAATRRCSARCGRRGRCWRRRAEGALRTGRRDDNEVRPHSAPGGRPGQRAAVLARVKAAARRLRRWSSASFDPGCARRPRKLWPGRRNGARPTRETPSRSA
jgi:hypothetical protein